MSYVRLISASFAVVVLLFCSSVRAQESSHIGLKIRTLTVELRKQHRITEDVKGVLVTTINPGSPAQEKEIVVGDVIVEAGGKPIANAKDVAGQISAATAAGSDTISFRIVNEKGERRDVTVAIGKRPVDGSKSLLPGPIRILLVILYP